MTPCVITRHPKLRLKGEHARLHTGDVVCVAMLRQEEARPGGATVRQRRVAGQTCSVSQSVRIQSEANVSRNLHMCVVDALRSNVLCQLGHKLWGRNVHALVIGCLTISEVLSWRVRDGCRSSPTGKSIKRAVSCVCRWDASRTGNTDECKQSSVLVARAATTVPTIGEIASVSLSP